MGKIAYLFPGQGSQYIGMGKELYNNYQEMKDVFNIANETLGFDLVDLCFNGTIEELSKTSNTQPAILTMSIGILNIINKKPDYVMGLSLGEYSALTCSGVIDFKEAVSLIRKRGELMENAQIQGSYKMVAVMGLSNEEVENLCSEFSKIGFCKPANYNTTRTNSSSM